MLTKVLNFQDHAQELREMRKKFERSTSQAYAVYFAESPSEKDSQREMLTRVSFFISLANQNPYRLGKVKPLISRVDRNSEMA